MSKFKVGDKVVKKSGEAFSNGENVVTVKETMGEVVFFDETSSHIGEAVLDHYGQTLAELNVKAGDVVELLTHANTGYIGSICYINGRGRAVARDGSVFMPNYDNEFERTYRIVTRASDTPNWLPCPANYKPQDSHEVTYHMGVPTHYYVKEPVLVDVERAEWIMGSVRSMCGQTRDGKPVGQWTIDMDAD